MVKVKCLKHKRLHEQGTKCPLCEQARHKRYNDERRDKERSRFYNSKEWRIVRQKVIDYYSGVDLWHLGLTGKLKPCANITVHHIYEYSKYPSLALASSNLITVSAQSHNEIHIYYDSGRFEEALEIINNGKALFEKIKNNDYTTTTTTYK
jgi:hypothetical protein